MSLSSGIRNTLWRGTSWTVKNLLELKTGRRVVIRRNLLEYNWAGAQPGFAIVFTPRNSSGHNPWVVIEDVEFSENVVRHSGGGFNLLGYDDTAISGQLARVLIKNNLVYDISGTNWGGAGLFAQIGGEPRDITFDHNTVIHTGNIVTFYSGRYYDSSGTRVTGGPIQGFVFTNNLLRVMATDSSKASRYPADNQFPTIAAFNASFVDPAVRDYRLVASSSYIGAGLDGEDIGCAVQSVLVAGIK